MSDGFMSQLKSQTTNDELDQLFLSENFDPSSLFTGYDVIVPEKDHLTSIEQAELRVKSYTEILKQQIVHVVVDNQADGFLQVASQLEDFKAKFSKLRHGIQRYHFQVGSTASLIANNYQHIENQNEALVEMCRQRDALIGKIEQKRQLKALSQ